MKLLQLQDLFDKENAHLQQLKEAVRQSEIKIYQIQGRYSEAQEREKEDGPILRTGKDNDGEATGERDDGIDDGGGQDRPT